MSTEKLRGVVIKETAVGESDKIITLLTKEKGKITVSARGARKPKSKYLSSCEVFAYSDFVIYTARKNPSVSSAVLIESFYGLRQDIRRLAAAAYFADFLNRHIYEGADCQDLLLLILTAFKKISAGKTDPVLASYIFELKYLSLSGMLPDISAFYTVFTEKKEEILPGTVKALDFISSCDIKNVFNFNVSGYVLNQIKDIRESMAENLDDIHLKSRDFMLQVFGN
ncbi:MAG: DNA repair protein RecO [Clostridiales bacterium]|nr:DNA repair protein RecO [Clostridiales bacterium]